MTPITIRRSRTSRWLFVALLLTTLAAASFITQTRAPAQSTTFSFTAQGDIGADAVDTNAVMAAIRDSGSVFSIALGDMSYNEVEPESAWCDYIKSYVGAAFPFQLISGNHEEDGAPHGHINNYAGCLPDRMGSTGTYAVEYYFDYNNLRVILIAPDLTINGIYYDYNTVGSARYDWVRDRIREAKAAGKWVVVGMHKNCITTGVKDCAVGENLMDLLIAEGTDLVLHAHDHTYQRSKQLICADAGVFIPGCVVDGGGDNFYTRGAGTVFVITGAAGGWHMYNVSRNDSEAGYFSKIMGGSGGFDLVNDGKFSGGNGTIKFTVSTDRIDGQFSIAYGGGTFSDCFSIVSGGATAPPCAGVMHLQEIFTSDSAGNLKTVFKRGEFIYWRVKVIDQNDIAVSGASVSTTVVRPDGQTWTTQTSTTGSDGWALFTKKSLNGQPTGTYTINVTNVTKSGAAYDPAANIRSSTTYTLQ
jgi:hypothetical protein